MRYLILSHPEDLTAMAVYSLLTERHGSSDCWHVLVNDLLSAPFWHHALRGTTAASEIHLVDGRVLRSGDLGCVFNRVRHAYALQFVDKDDQDYAIMEWSALLLSWLYSLPCPVVNNVQPVSFGGQIRDRFEWLALAARSGLPVQGYRFTTDTRHFARPDYTANHRSAHYDENGQPRLELVSGPLVDLRPVHFLEEASGSPLRAFIAGHDVFGSPEIHPFIDKLLHLGRLIDAEIYAVTFSLFDGALQVSNLTTFPSARSPAETQAIVSLLEQK